MAKLRTQHFQQVIRNRQEVGIQKENNKTLSEQFENQLMKNKRLEKQIEKLEEDKVSRDKFTKGLIAQLDNIRKLPPEKAKTELTKIHSVLNNTIQKSNNSNNNSPVKETIQPKLENHGNFSSNSKEIPILGEMPIQEGLSANNDNSNNKNIQIPAIQPPYHEPSQQVSNNVVNSKQNLRPKKLHPVMKQQPIPVPMTVPINLNTNNYTLSTVGNITNNDGIINSIVSTLFQQKNTHKNAKSDDSNNANKKENTNKF